MDPEDLFPALHIGRAYVHLTVKPSGAEQRRVQDVLPVGGRQDHHALVAAEAVHFHQQLVQRLFPFVMAAAKSRAAMPAHRIDFINTYDTRRIFLRLFEKVARS